MKKHLLRIAIAAFSIIGFTMTPPLAHADITTSLFGYWKLDEGSGTSAADSSGNSNTGTLVNSPAWFTPGNIWSSALRFTSASNTYVSTLNDQAQSTSFTWASWLNPTSFPGASSFNIFLSTTQGMGFFADSSGHLEFFDRNATFHNTGISLATNAWTHVAVVCFASGASVDSVTIYINGSQALQDTNLSGACNMNLPSPQIYMGNYAPAPTANLGWTGAMQEVRVYNRDLSSADIAELYAFGSVPPAPPPLHSFLMKLGRTFKVNLGTRFRMSN